MHELVETGGRMLTKRFALVVDHYGFEPSRIELGETQRSSDRDPRVIVAELPDDHHCPWREEAERLRVELHEVRTELTEVRAKLAPLHMTAMESLERRSPGR